MFQWLKSLFVRKKPPPAIPRRKCLQGERLLQYIEDKIANGHAAFDVPVDDYQRALRFLSKVRPDLYIGAPELVLYVEGEEDIQWILVARTQYFYEEHERWKK